MLDHTTTGGAKDNPIVVEEVPVIISNAASKRQKLELKVRLCVCLFLFSCVCTSLLYVDSAAKYFIGIGCSIFLLFGIDFFGFVLFAIFKCLFFNDQYGKSLHSSD